MGKYDELNEVAKEVALSYEETKAKVERYLKYSATTDKAKAVKHLWEKREKGLTQHDAYNYNDYRLSAKVKDLRDDEAFAIITVDEKNLSKKGCHGRYFLILKSDIMPDGTVKIGA